MELLSPVSPTPCGRGITRGGLRSPSAQHTGQVVTLVSVVRAVRGYQGLPYQDPLSLDLSVLEKGSASCVLHQQSVHTLIFLLREGVSVKGTLTRGSGLSEQEIRRPGRQCGPVVLLALRREKPPGSHFAPPHWGPPPHLTR